MVVDSMLHSIVIPARNEELNLPGTVTGIYQALSSAEIDHEIIVVDDGSTDGTPDVLSSLKDSFPTLRPLRNTGPHGFGLAIGFGLAEIKGQTVTIIMADGSDEPNDLVRFIREYRRGGCDCVFGTRFSKASKLEGYPFHKLVLNRIVNQGVRLLFGFNYNDLTNAFKLYSAETIKGLHPLLSSHFNLTVELPLKAIVRGYRYRVISNNWYGRTHGRSNLRIKEMGSRYLFIIIYCFIERWLSCGDYLRSTYTAKAA